MKKRFILICVIVLAIAGASTAVWAVSDRLGAFNEPPVSEKADVNDDVDEEVPENKAENEIKAEAAMENGKLSSKDAAVKAEIAKYNTKAADFSYNKQEALSGKKYSLVFGRVGYSGGDEAEKVTYLDNSGNEFVYNSETGELFFAQLTSLAAAKTADSIDINAAERKAYAYAAGKCQIDSYKISYSNENSRGYTFVYSKYISDLRTTDSVEVTVGYNGEIVGVRINTGIFDDKSITVNREDIDGKINAELSKYKNAEVQDKWLDIYNGKTVLNCQLRYEASGTTAAAVAMIPLE